VKDRTELVITQKSLQSFVSQVIEAGNGQLAVGNQQLFIGESFERTKDFVVPTARKIACLDADKVRFPLQLRKWKEGDWFCPLGMNKKKLISDFLIDQKVPLNLKKDVYLLTSNGSIVWVMGMRIDDRFKVTDKTEKVVLLKIE
jgi:tRNA(Ile)-lysidine synthase